MDGRIHGWDATGTHKKLAVKVVAATCDELINIFPCTPLQEVLMVLSAKDEGEYIIRMVIDLSTRTVDIERFKAAWASVYRSISMSQGISI